MAAKFLINLLHSIPRFTFTFKAVHQSFTLKLNSSYIQALLVIAVIALLIGIALLFTVITTWICQCCNKQNSNAKCRRRVHRLSLILFIISILCFFCLGVCLFGNEYLNRGITSSVVATKNVIKNMQSAETQCNNLNETRLNMMKNVESLANSVKNEAQKKTTLNETFVKEVEMKIDEFERVTNRMGLDLKLFEGLLSARNFLERSTVYAERIELERWILCATLLSIMLIVLFAGVISFCRQSKKGAIVFSGLGFAIFIVGWLLFVTIFPINIALADFCVDGGSFIRDHMTVKAVEIFKFYSSCDPRIEQYDMPGSFEVNKFNNRLSEAQELEAEFHSRLNELFHDSQVTNELYKLLKLIKQDIAMSLKNFGGFEATISCNVYHNDISNMENGFCNHGIIGSSILFYSLALLEAFLFALLLIVSRSWYFFARMSSDYVEVDEEDPFFPRGNDSTIPVDIYGTHVYNPRTRFASSLDRTEQSTGTTTATGGLANGSAANHTSASTALLNSNEDSPAPLWHRGLSGSTGTSTVNAPPAVGTNSIARTVYATNNDEAAYRYRNYHEQFDV